MTLQAKLQPFMVAISEIHVPLMQVSVIDQALLVTCPHVYCGDRVYPIIVKKKKEKYEA